MADTPPHPAVDPERTAPANAFDTPTGHSGQEFNRDRQAAEDAAGADPVSDPASEDGRNLPPETGRRAFVAPNGEVHGSGAGAGGGAPGEDFDLGTPGAVETPQAGAGPDRKQA